MPSKTSTAKRHRQSLKRRMRNRMAKSEIKSAKRDFFNALEGNDREKAEAQYKKVASLLDVAARKGVLHKNAAARTKSRLRKKVNSLAA